MILIMIASMQCCTDAFVGTYEDPKNLEILDERWNETLSGPQSGLACQLLYYHVLKRRILTIAISFHVKVTISPTPPLRQGTTLSGPRKRPCSSPAFWSGPSHQ